MWNNIKVLGFPCDVTNPEKNAGMLTIFLVSEEAQFTLPVILNPKGVDQDILVNYEPDSIVIDLFTTDMWEGELTKSGLVSTKNCRFLFQYSCLMKDYDKVKGRILTGDLSEPFPFTSLLVFS